MNDPYTDTDICVDRLYKEYLLYKRLILACDFDDTLFDFHKAGHTYQRAVEAMKRCSDLGFYVVLFTGTKPDKWDWQTKYCGDLGIKIASVNKNPIELPFGNDGKIYYNIFLDDRAGLAQSLEILEKTIDKITGKGQSGSCDLCGILTSRKDIVTNYWRCKDCIPF